MRYSEREVGNISDLLGLLQEDAERLRKEIGGASIDTAEILHVPVWFRGLVEKNWSLITTMFRNKAIDKEVALMNRFKQNAPQLVERQPENDWGWMYLMRHHGLPSRLLDWTESTLIGLYFGVTPSLQSGADQASIEREDKKDGALWCLLPTELNAKSSLYSQGPFDIPMLEDPASNSQMYLPDNVSAKQLTTKIGPGAAIGMRASTRMQAQQGVFVITHRDETPIEKISNGDHVWRYIIPAGKKRDLRRELHLLGITPLVVFPELDNVAFMARRALNV